MASISSWMFGLVLLLSAAEEPVANIPSSRWPEAEDMLSELNRLRKRPADFAILLEEWLPLFDGEVLRLPGEVALRTREGKAPVEEAIDFLKKAAPAPSLSLSSGMSRAAAEHAADLGRTGSTDHLGSDGSTPSQRVRRHGKWKGKLGENLGFGEASARRMVLLLLVDDGVPSRNHRKSLLDGSFRVAGIACGPHPVYRSLCVIDLASKFVEKSNP